MTSVLIRKRNHRREDHVKMEAEIVVILPKAKEHLKLPKAGREEKGFYPEVIGGNSALSIC